MTSLHDPACAFSTYPGILQAILTCLEYVSFVMPGWGMLLILRYIEIGYLGIVGYDNMHSGIVKSIYSSILKFAVT